MGDSITRMNTTLNAAPQTAIKTIVALRRITQSGLQSYKTSVQLTSKKSPNYRLVVAQLEAAQKHFDATRSIEQTALSAGFIRNKFDGVDAIGNKIKAFQGFAKKNEDGKWSTHSWDSVVSTLRIEIADLPEIPE